MHSTIISVSQMGKLELTKFFAQCHKASKWWRLDSNSSGLTPHLHILLNVNKTL